MITRHITSAATNNAQTLDTTGTKGRGPALYSVNAFNAGVAAAYVKLYNKASLPVVGTDVPLVVIAVPTVGNGRLEVAKGIQFPLGLQLAIVTGAADTDNTAVAAAQVHVTVVFGA